VCCSVLQCVALCCSVLRCVAVWLVCIRCRALRVPPLYQKGWEGVACCSDMGYVLQRAAACCSVLRRSAASGWGWLSVLIWRRVKCVAVCCGVLQCVSVCCSVLQRRDGCSYIG